MGVFNFFSLRKRTLHTPGKLSLGHEVWVSLKWGSELYCEKVYLNETFLILKVNAHNICIIQIVTLFDGLENLEVTFA